MQVSFVKLSPTQNVTVLVTDPVPRAQQPALAAKLLAYDSVGGEQVGFLETPVNESATMRLQMMGGEFCGNASMSVGAYLARQEGLADGEQKDYLLEVSGASDLVSCRILRQGNAYRGTVRMPLPERFEEVTLPTDAGMLTLPAVRLPGIVHVIADVRTNLSQKEIESRIRSWNEIVHADALGVLRYDASTGEMQPIVYVPATDSAVWERGCGSGTASLGCYLANRQGRSCRTSVRQPGGIIDVEALVENDRVTRLSITGTVNIMADGTAYIP